ncbi:hypothetical protein KIW84_045866 [Lathyrus oleraceus]|uniref:Uncharacterized protein n=1 Tax=Pisum sativum TaxID=3888 RepID=A0A9D4XLQ9_PEA|nr:hypothetical protein KIW84_045866 [Pisum sativum]
MTFIIKIFQYLTKKKNTFSGKAVALGDQVQEDKAEKGSFQKDNFRNKFKKSFMATWYELDKEEDSEKDEEQTNIALVALTSFKVEYNSDFGSESGEDEEFSKLSRSNLITFIQELMSR